MTIRGSRGRHSAPSASVCRVCLRITPVVGAWKTLDIRVSARHDAGGASPHGGLELSVHGHGRCVRRLRFPMTMTRRAQVRPERPAAVADHSTIWPAKGPRERPVSIAPALERTHQGLRSRRARGPAAGCSSRRVRATTPTSVGSSTKTIWFGCGPSSSCRVACAAPGRSGSGGTAAPTLRAEPSAGGAGSRMRSRDEGDQVTSGGNAPEDVPLAVELGDGLHC